jgi:deoxyribodipyrimidine photolyase
MDVLEAIKELLQLGWPAIVTVAIYLLAKQYMQSVESEIAYLRAQVATLEAELIKVKQQLLTAHLADGK